MGDSWSRCAEGRFHRSQAEAEACPACLQIFKPTPRKRRGTPALRALPPDTNDDLQARPFAAPSSPSASWLTEATSALSSRNGRAPSSTTSHVAGPASPSTSWVTLSDANISPRSSRATPSATLTPRPMFNPIPYPTPGLSQEPADRQPFTFDNDAGHTFTAGSESPTPPTGALGSLFHTTSELFQKWRPSSTPETDQFVRRNAITSNSFDADSVHDQASVATQGSSPRYISDSPIQQYSISGALPAPPIPTMTAGHSNSSASSVSSLAAKLPNLFGRRPRSITNNSSNHASSTTPPSDLDNGSTQPGQTINPYPSRRALVSRLEESTHLIENLHAREQIATIERDQARAGTQLLQDQLDVIRTEGEADRGDRCSCRVLWGIVILGIAGLLQWANRQLHQAEFEWIEKRNREFLGL